MSSCDLGADPAGPSKNGGVMMQMCGFDPSSRGTGCGSAAGYPRALTTETPTSTEGS